MNKRIESVKNFIYIICGIIALFIIPIDTVANPFETCIYPEDYSGADQADLIVSGGEIECAEQCEYDCNNAFSHITDYGESAADILDDCVKSCKNGISFTKKPRVSSTDFPLWKESNKSTTVTSSCVVYPQSGSGFAMMKGDKGVYVIQYATINNGNNTVDNFYYVIDSGMSITSDEITVTLLDGKNSNGFMCGAESSYLWPVVGPQGSADSAATSDKIGLQDPPAWDTNYSDNSNLDYWNVRNKNWTSFPYDSSISVQNGDYLSITYSGNYCQSTNCSIDTPPPTTLPPVGSTATYGYDRGLLLSLPDDTVYNFPGNSMVLPRCSTDPEGNTVCPVSSCQASFDDDGNPSCDIQGILNASNGTFGLSGNYYVSQVEIGNNGKVPVNVISFSGVLRNFSDDPVELEFQYNDAMSQTSTTSTGPKGCDPQSKYKYKSRCTDGFRRVDCCCDSNKVDYCGDLGVNSKRLSRQTIINYSAINQFADNTGGLIVSAEWKGCYFNKTNPEIEYALMPFSSMDSLNVNDYRGLTWNNVELDKPFRINGEGILMFRLKPKGAMLPSDVGGGYYLSVKRSATSYKGFGLNAVVQTINKQLFGSNISSSKMSDTLSDIVSSNSSGNYTNVKTSTPGIVQNIFTYLTQEPAFITTIRAALLLYIAYMGLAFMIGLSPINQKEALTMLLKFGVMTVLISGESWDFFNRYMFTAVIQGSADLMAAMIMNYNEYNTVSTGAKSVNLFSFLDPILLQLFSNTIWIKMIALFASSISAWIPAILLFISIILFIIFLFRVVMLYITSMIALSILTIVAPIFISFMLFQYTHNMFMGWLKQYISFAVQPVFVVTFASIIAKLIVFLLNSNLYFTVCKTCLIGWTIGPKNFCFLPSYMILKGLFGVEVGSINSPILSLESLMILYLVVNSANVLCNHLSGLAGEIVTGSMMSMNLANAAPSSPVALYGNLKNMIGMSDGAIGARAAIGKAGENLASFLQSRPAGQNTPNLPVAGNPNVPNLAQIQNNQNPIYPGQMQNPIQPTQTPINQNLVQPTQTTIKQNPVQPTQTPNIDGVPEVGNINNTSVPQGHQLVEGIGAGNIEGVGDSKIEGVGGGGLGVLENIQGNNEQAPSPPAADSVPQNQSGEENE